MKRRTVYALILVLAVTVCSCGKKPVEEKPVLLEAHNNEVDTAAVSRNDICSTQVYQAEVIPYIEELSFQSDGLLNKVYAEIGSKVEKGDVLARLRNDSKDKLAVYNGEKAELFSTYLQNRNTLQNDSSIKKLTGGDNDELELKLKHTDELYQLKNSQLDEKIDRLKQSMTGTPEITAPFDGKVVAVSNINAGSCISKGSPIIAVARPDKLQVACDFIAQSNMEKVQRCYAIINGKEYDIEYQAYSQDEIFKKMEEQIVYKLKQSGLVSKFNLTNADTSVQAGDYAMVCVVRGYRKNVLSLPVNAVYTESGKNYVFQMVDGKRTKTWIKTGLTDSINIEILSGIKEGATVYVSE